MARGHIGGSRRLQFDPSAFLQDGGSDKGDEAMAMALMGYGRGQSPEELGLSRAELMAKIAGETGTQDIEREKLEEMRRSNLSTEDFQKFQKEQTLKNAADELRYKQDVLGQEGKKNEMAMVNEYIKNHPELSAEQIQGMIGGFSPTMKQFFTGAADQPQAAKALTLLPSIQAAYKTGHPDEALKAMFADPNMAAILKRPEIPWQQLNEALGAQQAKSTALLFQGALTKPWQEYQGAPDLSQVFVPPPAPKGTEEIAPWLRPEAPAQGAMDWRYGGGGPGVDPTQYAQIGGYGINPEAGFARPQEPNTLEPGTLDRILATLGLR